MILKVERTWKHAKTAERNSTICVNAFFTNLLPKNVNVNVVIMIYCQGNSKFLGQKKNYSIHYLTSQNQGLSGLKNIWPVIMSGDLLSVLFSALCQWWAEANNWSARHWQITIFCNNRSEVKRSAIFAQQQLHKGESLVLFTHEQNIICSQTKMDGIAHEQTIIWRQLFAGHMVGFRPIKNKKNLQRVIMIIIIYCHHIYFVGVLVQQQLPSRLAPSFYLCYHRK